MRRALHRCCRSCFCFVAKALRTRIERSLLNTWAGLKNTESPLGTMTLTRPSFRYPVSLGSDPIEGPDEEAFTSGPAILRDRRRRHREATDVETLKGLRRRHKRGHKNHNQPLLYEKIDRKEEEGQNKETQEGSWGPLCGASQHALWGPHYSFLAAAPAAAVIVSFCVSS